MIGWSREFSVNVNRTLIEVYRAKMKTENASKRSNVKYFVTLMSACFIFYFFLNVDVGSIRYRAVISLTNVTSRHAIVKNVSQSPFTHVMKSKKWLLGILRICLEIAMSAMKILVNILSHHQINFPHDSKFADMCKWTLTCERLKPTSETCSIKPGLWRTGVSVY